MKNTRHSKSPRKSQNYPVRLLPAGRFRSDYSGATPCLSHSSTRRRPPRGIPQSRGDIMRVLSAGTAALLLVVAGLTACTDRTSAPTGISAARSGVPFAAGLASPTWQATAATRASQANFSPLAATHAYGLVGVAQYWAVQRADAPADDNGRSQLEAERGAVAGASAVVLTYLFPAAAQSFEDLVTAQSNAGPGQSQPSFARGEEIGRAVGAEIVARAQADGF